MKQSVRGKEGWNLRRHARLEGHKHRQTKRRPNPSCLAVSLFIHQTAATLQTMPVQALEMKTATQPSSQTTTQWHSGDEAGGHGERDGLCCGVQAEAAQHILKLPACQQTTI